MKRTTVIPLGLLGLFAVLLLPFDGSGAGTNVTSIAGITSEIYGMATITHYDANGDVVFTQQVHNNLVDTGEIFLLQAAFVDGNAVADATSIGAICVTNATSVAEAETQTASSFDTDNGIESRNNCEMDTTVTISTTESKATIGPLTFNAGDSPANVPSGTQITGIGICQSASTGTSFSNCAGGGGILFAEVDTSEITLNSGETVQITYEFDLSSNNS